MIQYKLINYELMMGRVVELDLGCPGVSLSGSFSVSSGLGISQLEPVGLLR